MPDSTSSQNSEPKHVDVNMAVDQQNNEQNQNNTQQVAPLSTNQQLSALIETNVLNILTQMDFTNEEELRQKNAELLSYLAKLIELLKEKTTECVNLEKQNLALTQQAKSLKEVVSIVKDLLNIRNMEVTHLQQDIASMQDKINDERVRQNKMLEKVEHASKLNDRLKEEYQKQYAMFQDVRSKYEQKLEILVSENQKLQEQKIKEKSSELNLGSLSLNGDKVAENVVNEAGEK